MHIPDGILSDPVWIALDITAAGAVGVAVRGVNRTLDAERAPVLGMTAAFIFAAQMINFQVLPGVSGHLMGGFLAAILLGPAAAVVVLTTVLGVQCLFFADGGLIALGANIINLGVIGSLGGYGPYRLLRAFKVPEPAALGFGAWFSVMVAAAAVTAEMVFSGKTSPGVGFPAMLGVHALIGMGEAAITLGALGVLARARPEWVPGQRRAAVSDSGI